MTARANVRSAAVATAVLILGWMGFSMSDDASLQDTPPQTLPPRSISVRLLGPASEITGIAVPKNLASQNDTYLHAPEPSEVTVRLPRDRIIRSWSKLTSINADHGIVVDIYLLPLPKAVPFRDAVSELRRILREMKIEPDEKMLKDLDGLPDDSGPVSYRTQVSLGSDMIFLAKIRPAPDAGFYLALTFAVEADARRVFWDPTFKPKTTPLPNGADKQSK